MCSRDLKCVFRFCNSFPHRRLFLLTACGTFSVYFPLFAICRDSESYPRICCVTYNIFKSPHFFCSLIRLNYRRVAKRGKSDSSEATVTCLVKQHVVEFHLFPLSKILSMSKRTQYGSNKTLRKVTFQKNRQFGKWHSFSEKIIFTGIMRIMRMDVTKEFVLK